MFATRIEDVLARVDAVDPVRYARTRNFLDGAVTRLSPYISRGVISTRGVLEAVLARRDYRYHEIEKLAQELAWRDYFQNVWRAKNIDADVRQPQPDVRNTRMPRALVDGATGVEGVDRAVRELYETGYVHNHLRMYVAAVACNLGKSHWKVPAKWFYYHLLDADWASNALSWQWTAGAFSNKKYYANQENINKYCGTRQRGTFLDVDYAEFPALDVPEALRATDSPALRTPLPPNEPFALDPALPVLVYNFYNLDPFWRREMPANRVLLLEPSHFDKYPVSAKTLDFVRALAANIDGIKTYVGEFAAFVRTHNPREVYYKEHPTAAHYTGVRDERDWLFPEAAGYYPSFFGFWKKCERLLKLKIKN